MQPPVRAVRLTLKLDADDLQELAHALRNIADYAERDQLTIGCSGSPSSGYIYELLQDPAMTHTRYHAELRAYLDQRATKRDWCTDADNCKRCKAPTWDQVNHSHAGIPVGAQKAA
jgi:hypothetical protein